MEVWSAPSNINFKSRSQVKLMADAQKKYKAPHTDEDGEKVHIPENFDDSDSNSDSFTQKIAMLTNDNAGQSSKQGGSNVTNKHVWFMSTEGMDSVVENIIVNKKSVEDMICDNACNTIQKSAGIAAEGSPLECDKADGVDDSGISKSPEIFLTDDLIIHSQESLAGEATKPAMESDDKVLTVAGEEISKADAEPMCKLNVQRRSERLKKETTLTTKEKTEKITRKRNLEGNTSSCNSFSALPVEDVVSVSADMGVVLDKNDFATFDLLKDLETARHNLYEKQNKDAAPQTEPVEENHDDNNTLTLTWMHDESSEAGEFILVESKRRKREKRKSLKLSPKKKGANKIRKVLTWLRERGGDPERMI